jgi:hypothetical protein
MTIETDLVAALAATFGGRFYADTAPPGTARPFATYQQVGGRPLSFLRGQPDKHNMRLQVNVWADNRNDANTKMRAAAAILVAAPFNATPLGELVATYDEITTYYGAMQDWSLWHA